MHENAFCRPTSEKKSSIIGDMPKLPSLRAQECMFEHRDWRKCQDLVKNFRICMEEYERNKDVRALSVVK
uniref:CHCH domain-containing protein n=1 Tax=Romanomermis culicivorax TaxID=13658 RepID=A0A915HG28_ROMCU